MNALEIFKLLPKKNCGDCHQKLCMPFAFAVSKGDVDISECPLLSSEEIESISHTLVKSDWRENLISKLKQEISNISFSQIKEGIGAELIGDVLKLRCMGRDFHISPEGEITTIGHITPLMKILLLNYIKMSGKCILSEKWVSFSELKNGMLKSIAFKTDCEESLNRILSKSMDNAEIILTSLGAKKQDVFETKYAWHIYLLPKIPILILYWKEEEEFPSQTKILFDYTADCFLDVESLVFLVEELIKNIESGISVQNK